MLLFYSNTSHETCYCGHEVSVWGKIAPFHDMPSLLGGKGTAQTSRLGQPPGASGGSRGRYREKVDLYGNFQATAFKIFAKHEQFIKGPYTPSSISSLLSSDFDPSTGTSEPSTRSHSNAPASQSTRFTLRVTLLLSKSCSAQRRASWHVGQKACCEGG